MEPPSSSRGIEASAKIDLNSVLLNIHEIAESGPAVFKNNLGTLFGRSVSHDQRGENVPSHLAAMIQYLIDAKKQNLLTFENTPDSQSKLDNLVLDLRRIKLYLEDREISSIAGLDKVIEQVIHLAKSLRPKRKHPEQGDALSKPLEEMPSSPPKIDLSKLLSDNTSSVAFTREVIEQLECDDYIVFYSNKYMLMSFEYGLGDIINDQILDAILSYFGTNSDDGFFGIDDLTKYPKLSPEAPAIVAKYLTEWNYYPSFKSIAFHPRFMDLSVNVGAELIPTNKALLFLQSEKFKELWRHDEQYELSSREVGIKTIKLFLELLIGKEKIYKLPLISLCELALFAHEYECIDLLTAISSCIAQDIPYEIASFRYKFEDLKKLENLHLRMQSKPGLSAICESLIPHLQCVRIFAK